MKTMRGFRAAAALLLSAAMGSAMAGWPQRPTAEGEEDLRPQERHPSDVAILVQPDNESAEGGAHAGGGKRQAVFSRHDDRDRPDPC